MSDTKSKMPERIYRLHLFLSNETQNLYSIWLLHEQCFAKEEKVAIFNRAAPSFFRAVQDAFRDSLFLHLCRITDKPIVGGRENLSLDRLRIEIEQDGRAGLVGKLNAIIDEIYPTVLKIRSPRNTRLAHLDYKCAVNPAHRYYKGITKDEIKFLLDRISAFLNEVSGDYDDRSTLYDLLVHQGDGDTVAHLLEVGLAENTAYVKRKIRARQQAGS